MSPRAGLDQEKVLTAAAELVDREGANGLTVGRLAEVLGVRPPSLYNHMRSVEQVQQELAALALQEMGRALRQAATGLAGFDALSAIAMAYRQYALAHPGLYALTLRSREGDPRYAAAAQEMLEVVLAVLRGYRLGAEEAIHATRCLRSSLHGFVSLEAAGGFGMPVEVAASFERLIQMLDRGLREQAPGRIDT